MIDSIQNDIRAGGGTPLKSSLLYAQKYFKGERDSDVCQGTAACISPVLNRCQKNYIILFTDGDPSSYNEDPTSIAKKLAKEGLKEFPIPGTGEKTYYPGRNQFLNRVNGRITFSSGSVPMPDPVVKQKFPSPILEKFFKTFLRRSS